jgi:hypothetical protein
LPVAVLVHSSPLRVSHVVSRSRKIRLPSSDDEIPRTVRVDHHRGNRASFRGSATVRNLDWPEARSSEPRLFGGVHRGDAEAKKASKLLLQAPLGVTTRVPHRRFAPGPTEPRVSGAGE